MFFKNKDPISSDLKSKCVYSYTCGRCKSVYIGETLRHFSRRRHEHLEGYPTPTEISAHPHKPEIENFKLLATTRHHKLLESIMIKENLDQGNSLLNLKDASIPLLLKL